ncbi:MAG TPA: FG-GAP-like repeat-containing protein [Candidatus Eisenbacteria bacterium]
MRTTTLVSTLFVAFLAIGAFHTSDASAAASNAGSVSDVALAAAPAERAAAVSGVAPALDPVADMTVNAGETADQALHATDADGDPLAFYRASGPTFFSVTTTDPGAGSATGNVHLAPDTNADGVSAASVGVTDGQLSALRFFQITVVGTNSAPILTQPNNMTVKLGATQDQPLHATDANGDPVLFSKVSGPAFVTIATVDAGNGSATGNVHAAPTSVNDVANWLVTARASDGVLSATKTFTVTVLPNAAPYLSPVYDMVVHAGSAVDQTLYAYDNDGDPLTFSSASGPAYMTVTTLSPGAGSAVGNLHLAPPSSEVGNTTGTVRVTDGALSAQQSFNIFLLPPDQPPVMSQPADMTATIGEVAEQMVSATDADGDYLTIGNVSGPPFMAVLANYGYGTATATIRLTPGQNDVGVTTGIVGAFSGSQVDSASFQITVSAGNFPPPCGANAFSPVSTIFGYGLIEVQAGDLNGDGLPDVLVEIPGSGRAATALGNGDGSFGQAQDLDAGYDPVSGAIADFNGDEFPDVAVFDVGSGNVYTFLGDGTGNFASRHAVQVGGARTMVSADVNRDGKPDLLLANPNTSSVAVLRGIGDGTFQTPTSIPAGYAAWALATPDLNGDGAPDLVVVNAGDDDISVFRNNGSGSFGSRSDYPVGSEPLGVVAADLDGNGTADVAVSNAYSNSISVFSGNGNGTLGTKRTFSTGGGPRQVVVEDMNGDGHPDLATANFDANTVSTLLGDGSGGFGAHSDVFVGNGPYGMTSADFNDDLRPDLAVATYYGGALTVLLNGCAPERDHPPVVKAPSKLTGTEGSLITFTITANDPDGPALTGLTADFSALPIGHNATFSAGAGNTSGTFAWTPSYQSSRPTPYAVTFTATNVLSGSATTKITVLDVNRPPVADAGGPYYAFVGAPLALDGTGSSDPDGDPLTYAWVFGDGKSGTGANPVHTYAALGVYGIALTVSDGHASDLGTTTANVVGVFEARAFTENGNRSIRLSAGKPQWCVDLEPIGRSYANVTVDLGSIVMKSTGTGSLSEIHAIAGKTSVNGDHDGNGVEEITACFTKDDLRLLFDGLRGKTTVTVTFEGSLYTGGIFRAAMDVQVTASGGALAASISPNPLNPDAVLTFRTDKAGAARVNVFDLNGRLVMRLLDEANLPSGYHDVRISGRGENGVRMASGVYFFRIEAADAEQTGRFTILK